MSEIDLDKKLLKIYGDEKTVDKVIKWALAGRDRLIATAFSKKTPDKSFTQPLKEAR